MTQNGENGHIEANAARIWRFADCEIDELSRQLRVNGVVVDLEAKPLDVLLHLLLRAGEVVTKEELLDAVWPGLMVVDGSLATAISKLRRALEADHASIIVTLPRIGYRLAVPVHSKLVVASSQSGMTLKAGDTIAGREHWKLIRPLQEARAHEVWLAKHVKTQEARVFKFAWDGARLTALKREVTLYRYLRETLGARPEFVRVLDWNFATLPFFVESEFSGADLTVWAEQRGGLARIPMEERMRVMMCVGQAVAAAHDVGILHKDLKPENILVQPDGSGVLRVQVADFGSALMMEPARLAALGITNHGFTTATSVELARSDWAGTLMYLAPEVLSGHSATASADVYALGVLLYQMLIADFRAPFSPGWELDVKDPLLREDIALAASGDPARRLTSVADLVTRLQTLEERRAERNLLEATERRALFAEQRLTLSRARRPWILAASAALAIGFSISLTLYLRAARDRDLANRQTAIATATNRFLANDLLGRSNPFQSGNADESFVEAVKQASPSIDLQFSHEPQVAAHLHHTIARALDNRSNYSDARKEYDHSVRLFQQANGELSQDAIVARLQQATMEARSYEKGSLQQAKAILAAQEMLMAQLPKRRGDLPVWHLTAKGTIALVENNAGDAVESFQSALERAQGLPASEQDFDQNARLNLEQRLAFAYIRRGDGAKAERLLRKLIASYTQISGPNNPSVLRVRLNLAQAFMIQNKHKDAIAEANLIYPEFVQRLGKDHELTMQLLTTRAQSEGSLGIWDDAVRDDLAIYDLAIRKQGPLSFYAIATLSDAALAQCRGKDFRMGEANARKAYEASKKAFGVRAGLTGGTAYTLASCLVGLEKAEKTHPLDEASTLLQNIDIPVVAQLAGIPDWGANVALLQAQIAFHKGDYEASRRYLDQSRPAFVKSDAERYQRDAVESLSAELERTHAPSTSDPGVAD